MKNLFERLKPEYLEMLKNAETLYPSSIPSLFFALKSNHFWCDLSYHCIFSLLNHLDIYDYSPTTIINLFEND